MKLSLISAVLVPSLLAIRIIAQDPSNSDPTPSQTSQSNSKQTKPFSKVGTSSHRYHLRLGTVAFSGAYISGPLWFPYPPYGFYPYFGAAFEPFWAPFSPYYYPASLAYRADKGQIQLKSDPKDAAVYIDGAYAGTVQHLKNIWLDPGAYDVSISAAGREPFQRRIYILTGKTLNISAKLTRQAVSGTNEEKP